MLIVDNLPCEFYIDYGYRLQFRNAEDASVALVQMNGFPLAGRPLKVGRSERSACFPDIGEVDKIGSFMSPSSMLDAMSNPLAAATAAAAGELNIVFYFRSCLAVFRLNHKFKFSFLMNRLDCIVSESFCQFGAFYPQSH